MIPLVKNTITDRDIDTLIEWLQTYPRLTKNGLCIQFEEEYSKWLGMDNSIFVNSGSSAIMLVLAAIKNFMPNGTKVVVPALSWATDLSSVMLLGFEPILCDCNMQNLCVDPEYLEGIFRKEKPFAFIFVSVLGLVPNMEEISFLCSKYGVVLIEDICEALGSRYENKKLGTYGMASVSSMYFGHHMSTVEGGMISTNDRNLANIMRAMRAHGWERDCDEDCKKALRKESNVSEFERLYTFYFPGMNIRNTDLHAFIGIQQLKTLDEKVEKRFQNYKHYCECLSDEVWKPFQPENRYVSAFAHPLIVEDRETVIWNLSTISSTETRPLISGSLGRQPFYVNRYGIKELVHADIVHKNGLYVPNNPEILSSEIETICDVVSDRRPGDGHFVIYNKQGRGSLL